MAVKGKARVDRCTKKLLWRLEYGEIAVISHRDLDSLAARQLVETGARAVVNADCSFTGTFPGEGAILVLRKGLPLIDNVGPKVFDLVREGDPLSIAGGTVYRDGVPLVRGERLAEGMLEERLRVAKRCFAGVLNGFVDNTIRHALLEIKGIMDPPPALPPVTPPLSGRPAVVVVRGRGYREDLAALVPFIRANRPALVAVDGAADLLLELGFKPDLVFGDMDSVSDAGLLAGCPLVVHAYPDGRAPGSDRLRELDLAHKVFACPGTSEDAALLLVHAAGVTPVVLVGSHATPLDCLEKGRAGMASTLLVRLKLGNDLIDAKGLHKLSPPGKDFRQAVRSLDPAGLLAPARHFWQVLLGSRAVGWDHLP